MGCMAPGDIQDVISRVNTRYKLPTPPDVAATLTIKYGFRRIATFDHNGIHVTVRDASHEYLWEDLHEIHIARMDPLRRDFKSLVITLPDHEIELKLFTHQGGTSPTWRGATAEEVNEYLIQFVSPDRIHISIVGQQPTRREHIEKALTEAKKRMKEFSIMFVVFIPLIIGALLWMAIADGVLKAALMAAVLPIYPGSVIVFIYLQHRKKISELIESLKDAELHVDHCRQSHH